VYHLTATAGVVWLCKAFIVLHLYL